MDGGSALAWHCPDAISNVEASAAIMRGCSEPMHNMLGVLIEGRYLIRRPRVVVHAEDAPADLAREKGDVARLERPWAPGPLRHICRKYGIREEEAARPEVEPARA